MHMFIIVPLKHNCSMHFRPYAHLSKTCGFQFSHALRWQLLPVSHNEYSQWCSVGKTTTALNYSLEFHKVMTLLFAKIEDPLLLLLVQRLGKNPR